MGASKPRLRRALLITAIVVTALGGLAALFVYCPIVPRGPGVVTTSAQDFSLPDTKGDQVTLSSLVAHGPAVLVFYRGFW